MNRNNIFNIKTLIIAFVIIIIAFILGTRLSTNNSRTSSASTGSKARAPFVKARQPVNKTITISIKDDAGKEIGTLKFEILDADLQDEIIVKGQRATAVTGRSFLIANIKITNQLDKPIQINTKDYVRLSTNDSKEWLAPDIHNDPVQVQAISTKYTRVGFAINDTDKNLKLQIGEIQGNKDTIKLNLK